MCRNEDIHTIFLRLSYEELNPNDSSQPSLDCGSENSWKDSLAPYPIDASSVGNDVALLQVARDTEPYTGAAVANSLACLPSFSKEHDIFQDFQSWDWSTLYGGDMPSSTGAYKSTLTGDESNGSDKHATATQNEISITVSSNFGPIKPPCSLSGNPFTAPETACLPHRQSGSLTPTPSDDEVEDTADSTDATLVIGTILSNGRFKCRKTRCHRRSYGRVAELRRHYEVAHAPAKPAFWCPVSTCGRARDNGGRSFPRKDKLRCHIRSVHKGYGQALNFEEEIA